MIACDGSDFCFSSDPLDTVSYVHTTVDVKGYKRLHLNALYDLLNRTYIAVIIQENRQMNEKGQCVIW